MDADRRWSENLGGRAAVFDAAGRLQLAVLVLEGLNPSSTVVDVGCGSLRGGQWLMRFLDSGRYLGIEPHRERVEQGLANVLPAGLAETAVPTFAHNDDFDLGVFGRKFDFVIARSIWTHTSKAQIEAMLDSFVKWGEPHACMLVSYHPASRWRRPVTQVHPRKTGLTYRIFKRLTGRPTRRGDYRGDGWQAGNVSHSFVAIEAACRQRGLAVRELDYGVLANQHWLRIDHP